MPQQTPPDVPTETPSIPPLGRSVAEYVRAAFGGLVIETDEPEDALASLYALCDAEDWQLASWNLAGGLASGSEYAGDPIGALSALDAADGLTPLLLVLRGLHRFLGSPELISQLERRLHEGKTGRYCTILLVPSGGVELPPELRPLLVTLRHERPGREELEVIARGVATEAGETAADLSPVIDAAAGLTRQEAESACALSLVRHGRLSPGPLWDLKAEAIRTSGLMTLWRGHEGFGTLRGLAALKDFAFRSLTSDAGEGRGVLLLSPPGCGKSQFAKALAAETGRPLVQLDMGRLLGSLVGESERNLRQALGQIEALGKCICLFEEAEKTLAASGDQDSGVGSRLLGTLLTWMQDRASEAGAYVVMTCNEARRLPPELTRAERLDGTFFVDLPDESTRDDIWRLYLDVFGHPADAARPADSHWTGAEIRSCCRIARLLGVDVREAARFVVPIAVSSQTQIDRLRQWASGRCLDAHNGGQFQAPAHKPTSRRRSVTPKPSDN